MKFRHIIFIVLVCGLGCALTVPVRGQNLPFSKEQNKDNARFVWFVMQQEGFPYHYLPADSIRYSKHFSKVEAAKKQDGDVGTWKRYMAIYSTGLSGGKDMLTGDGPTTLKGLEKKYGAATWYRYKHGAAQTQVARVFDSLVVFTNPDNIAWVKADSAYDPDAGKGIHIWFREELIDAQGVQAIPSFSIIFANLPAKIRTADEFAKASNARLTTYDVLSVDTLSGSPFYQYHYNEFGLDHTVYTRYMVAGRIGVQCIVNTIDQFVPRIKRDAVAMLRSARFTPLRKR